MATSLGKLRDELLPGLATIEAAYGVPIVAYQEFNRDVLVIRAGDAILEIARSEIEDNRHLPKLRFFLETLVEANMCVKVAGSVATAPPPTLPQKVSDEFYAALDLVRSSAQPVLARARLGRTTPMSNRPSRWLPLLGRRRPS